MAEAVPVIAHSSSPGFLTEISMGRHSFFADEPVKDGGEDKGPTPYDLLLASLGACTCMTIRMYAAKKKLKLDDVKVYLLNSKVYASDCENCETDDAAIDRVERIVELHGELSDKEKEKIIDIANKCPVFRSISKGLLIETYLKDAS